MQKQRLHFRLGLGHAHSGLQPRKSPQRVTNAAVYLVLLRPIDLRRPENIRLLQPRHLKVSGQHADNTHRVAVNLDGLIHRSRVAVKPAQPQPVGDHGCRGTVRKVLFRREVSPGDRHNTQRRQKILRNVNAVQVHRIRFRQIAIAIAVLVRHRLKRFLSIAPIEEESAQRELLLFQRLRQPE